MTIAAIILVTTGALSWIAVRRCPLGKAIARQAHQVAESAR
jgi:hypothetical protein